MLTAIRNPRDSRVPEDCDDTLALVGELDASDMIKAVGFDDESYTSANHLPKSYPEAMGGSLPGLTRNGAS